MNRNSGCNAVSAQLANVCPHSQTVILGSLENFLRVFRGECAAVGEHVDELCQFSSGHSSGSSAANKFDIFLRPALKLAGNNMRAQQGGTTVPGHFADAFWIAASDLISASTVSPYPDLASTVVVPCSAISSQSVQHVVHQQFHAGLPHSLEAGTNSSAGFRDLLIGRARDALLKIHQPRRHEHRDEYANRQIREGPPALRNRSRQSFFDSSGSRIAQRVFGLAGGDNLLSHAQNRAILDDAEFAQVGPAPRAGLCRRESAGSAAG